MADDHAAMLMANGCVAEVSDMAQTMSEASRQYYKDAKYVNLQVCRWTHYEQRCPYCVAQALASTISWIAIAEYAACTGI